MAAGIPRSKISVDPGFGFGKTLHHNLQLAELVDDDAWAWRASAVRCQPKIKHCNFIW